jgi:hypothetical protein
VEDVAADVADADFGVPRDVPVFDAALAIEIPRPRPRPALICVPVVVLVIVEEQLAGKFYQSAATFSSSRIRMPL